MSDDAATWLREPEPGWVEVENQDLIFGHSFLSGQDGVLSVRYFRTDAQTILAKIVFGPRTAGAPGIAHGGSMAALFDELMGITVWSTGSLAFSVDLHVHFRKKLGVPNRYLGEARVERVDGRKVWTSARLRAVSGDAVFAEAEGLYMELVDRTALSAAGPAR
jgi:acyl-coenzyme A thioesterase PaaI-like protein